MEQNTQGALNIQSALSPLELAALLIIGLLLICFVVFLMSKPRREQEKRSSFSADDRAVIELLTDVINVVKEIHKS